MRIVIASTYVPFIRGGGTAIVDTLEQALAARGYDVETVKIPFRSEWSELPAQTLALRCLDLTESAGNRIDRLITIRYPSYALRHPNKVAWFIHHHRGAYDLWGTMYQDIPSSPEGNAFRESLIASDTRYLREATKIFTNSRTTAERLKRFNEITPDAVLFPPLADDHPFRAGPYGDYFLYSARLTPIKRQTLAIEAMRHVTGTFTLVLLGAADSEPYAAELRRLIRECRVEDKVRLTGWVSEDEKAELTAGARGCLYLAYDEDSYGFSTLEAFHARKAVVTLRDSGGTNEVIEHDWNGMIADPDARSLAAAMERVWEDPARARRMGDNAYDTLRLHRIDWDHVVQSLVS